MNKPLVSVVIPTFNRKDKLENLLQSLNDSAYNNLEIIVVDDCSNYDVKNLVETKIKKNIPLQVYTNQIKSYVTKSRNLGIQKSSGEYIFLIDDDNVLDKYCISFLVDKLDSDRNIGMVGPVMYYYRDPKIVWWAGTKRNMLTSKTNFIGVTLSIPDSDSWETDDFPNAWMFRKNITNNGIYFDESFSMHYEESDFAYKVKKLLNLKFFVVKKALIFHDLDLSNSEDLKRRWLDESRVKSTAKNRITFHRKYSKNYEFLLFLLFWNWLFVLYYMYFIWKLPFKNKIQNIKIALLYLKGTLSGFFNL
jgi:GT2 family glycosyltransferase